LANLALRAFYGNATRGEGFIQIYCSGLSSAFSRLQEGLAKGDVAAIYHGIHNANVAFDTLRTAMQHNFDNARLSTGDFSESDEKLILDFATVNVLKVEDRNRLLP
jgi:hypothetical protein